MNTTDALSIFAIVIASIAFFLTVGQVLQQYFATAEGYRRCRYSVMGQWSGFTYRKFRWSEFRFETRFTTPHIRIGAKLGEKFEIEKGQIPLLQSTVEVDENKEDTEAALRDTAEWVCWVPFVEDLEVAQTTMTECFPRHAGALKHRPKDMTSGRNTILPVLKFERYQPLNQKLSRVSTDLEMTPVASHAEPEMGGLPSSQAGNSRDRSTGIHRLRLASCALRSQSWDFMPPEALKPLAMIWVSDLAVLATRLGMKWLEFKPTENILRAEGNGLVLTSTQLRSMGCVTNVQKYAEPDLSLQTMFIPTEATNLMTFGYLPIASLSSSEMRLRARIGTLDDTLKWMSESGLPPECSGRMQKFHRLGSPLYGFVDIIPMTTGFLRQRGSQVIRVPAPLERPYGILHSETCRKVFPLELKKLIDGSLKKACSMMRGPSADLHEKDVEVLEGIAKRYRQLSSIVSVGGARLWTRPDDESCNQNKLPLMFLDEVHDQWDYTLTALEDIYKSEDLASDNVFRTIAWVHIKHSILANETAEKNVASDKQYRFSDDLMRGCKSWQRRYAETMHLLFERLPLMYADVTIPLTAEMCGTPPTFPQFTVAWAVIMFRAFCWDSCHYMVEGLRVGSEHYGSRMPIYIG